MAQAETVQLYFDEQLSLQGPGFRLIVSYFAQRNPFGNQPWRPRPFHPMKKTIQIFVPGFLSFDLGILKGAVDKIIKNPEVNTKGKVSH